MEITDEMVRVALQVFCDKHWRVKPDGRWIGYNWDAMRAALEAAYAARPPSIHITWSQPHDIASWEIPTGDAA
jgi:hypothetical protein